MLEEMLEINLIVYKIFRKLNKFLEKISKKHMYYKYTIYENFIIENIVKNCQID